MVFKIVGLLKVQMLHLSLFQLHHDKGEKQRPTEVESLPADTQLVQFSSSFINRPYYSETYSLTHTGLKQQVILVGILLVWQDTDQEQLGGGRRFSYRSQATIKGSQGRNPKAGTEAEVTEEDCLLACSPAFIQPAVLCNPA